MHCTSALRQADLLELSMDQELEEAVKYHYFSYHKRYRAIGDSFWLANKVYQGFSKIEHLQSTPLSAELHPSTTPKSFPLDLEVLIHQPSKALMFTSCGFFRCSQYREHKTLLVVSC